MWGPPGLTGSAPLEHPRLCTLGKSSCRGFSVQLHLGGCDAEDTGERPACSGFWPMPLAGIQGSMTLVSRGCACGLLRGPRLPVECLAAVARRWCWASDRRAPLQQLIREEAATANFWGGPVLGGRRAGVGEFTRGAFNVHSCSYYPHIACCILLTTCF